MVKEFKRIVSKAADLVSKLTNYALATEGLLNVSDYSNSLELLLFWKYFYFLPQLFLR
jgi:hypothetical protein